MRAKRSRFRAWRRGLREADLVLGRFADACADGLSEAELDRFEALLEEADADLYDWIAGLAEPPPRVDGDLIERIRAFAVAPTEPVGGRGA